MTNIIWFDFLSADSEKSFSPSVDETQPFEVPFRPYAWNNYMGSEIRHLVQQTYHHPLELERNSSIPYYGDRVIDASLFPERGSVAGGYSTYSSAAGHFDRAAATGLYSDSSLQCKVPDIKAEADILCSRLMLNGAFKCIKCSKVRNYKMRSNMHLLFISLQSYLKARPESVG